MWPKVGQGIPWSRECSVFQGSCSLENLGHWVCGGCESCRMSQPQRQQENVLWFKPYRVGQKLGKKPRMETLVPGVGTSPRCPRPMSGSSLPPPPAQASLISDRAKGPLTKITGDSSYQDSPTSPKFIVCLQGLFPSGLRTSGELQEPFTARRFIPGVLLRACREV